MIYYNVCSSRATGKTTLLKALAGTYLSDDFKVFLANVDCTEAFLVAQARDCDILLIDGCDTPLGCNTVQNVLRNLPSGGRPGMVIVAGEHPCPPPLAGHAQGS